MREKTSNFQKIILILILLMNISILYFIYQDKENRLIIENYFNDFFSEKKENIIKVEKEAEIENPIVIDTTDWKTYKDDLYDFEIKYPSTWAEPQTQIVDDKNLTHQYQVDFGTENTLNGNDDEGFSILVSKKNILDKKASKCNYICDKTPENQNYLEQEDYQETSPLHLFTQLKVAEDYTACYSCQFMGQDLKYELIPILDTDSNSSLLGINNTKKFETAKDTFVIDFETIQNKAIEQEKARIIAAEKARQARIIAAQAAEKARQAKLRSCPKDGNGDPSYSKTKGKHMDEDCCPDPDEWANPKCKYNASGLKLMIKK